MNKISICTVCMNRLSHLRETLPVNIIENMQFPNVEFVVLDYNSKDGMENWARSCMSQHIESGKLKYYKTYEPKYIRLSHSKNMALKLASGNILCLVDADNYAGLNYVDWINTTIHNNGKNSIITTLHKDHVPHRDQGGKLSFDRDFLHSVNGFDESLVGYGIEDVDLANRLEKKGGRRVFINEKEFLKFIDHSDAERLKNHHLINNLDTLYLQISDSMNLINTVLYLLTDNTFLEINYEFDEASKADSSLSHSGWIIKHNGHKKGSFQRVTGELSLTFENKSTAIYKEEDQGIFRSLVTGERSFWKKIPRNDELYFRSVKAYSECKNRLKYIENDKDQPSINPGGWGQGTVYLNFDRKNPIQVA